MYLHQESFARGQVSSRVLGLVSTDVYRQGCLVLENAVLGRLGSAKKRPGTKFLGETRGNVAARLIPFRVVGGGDYIVELTGGWLRVWDESTDALTDLGSGATDLATVYTTSEIDGVQWSQHDDTLYLVHENHPPQKLVRGTSSWTISEWVLSPPPLVSSTTSSVQQEPILTYTSANPPADPHTGTQVIPDRFKTENEDTFDQADDDGYWRFGGSWVYVKNIYNPRLAATDELTSLQPTTDVTYNEHMGPFQTRGVVLTAITFTTVPVGPDDEFTATGAAGTFTGKTGWVLDANWSQPGKIVVQVLKVNADGSQAQCQTITTHWLPVTGQSGINHQFYEPAERKLGNDWLQPSQISGSIEIYRGNQAWVPGDVGKAIFLNGGSATISSLDPADNKRAYCTVVDNLDNKWSTVDWAFGFSSGTGFPWSITQHANRMWLSGVRDFPRHIFASRVNQYDDWTIGSNANDGLSLELSTDDATRVTWIRTAADLGQGGTSNLVIGTDDGEWTISGTPITPTNLGADRHYSYGGGHRDTEHVESGVVVTNRDGTGLRHLTILDNRVEAPDLADIADDLFTSSPATDIAWVRDPDSLLLVSREGADLACLTYRPENGVAGWSVWRGLEAESVCSLSTATRDEVFLCVKRTIRGLEKHFIERIDRTVHMDAYKAGTTGLDHLTGTVAAVVGDSTYRGTFVVDADAVQVTGYATTLVGINYTFTLQPILPEYSDVRGATPGRRRQVQNINIQLRAASSYGTVAGYALAAREVEVMGPNRWYRVVGLKIDAVQPVIPIQCDDAVEFEVLGVNADTKQGVV